MGWILAILSGTATAFTYPTVFFGYRLPELGWVAFICWIPLFQAMSGVSPRRAFALSCVAGLFHYYISMYWLYTAMNSFGNLSPAISVSLLLLAVTVFSAYFGLIFLASQWVIRRTRLSPVWVLPVFWVGVEYLRGHLPMGGFPWSQVGYSQGAFLSFIQVADLAGVYGVTFLLILINQAGSELLLYLRKNRRDLPWAPAGAALGLFCLTVGYGSFRLHQAPPAPNRELKLGIVQGNIPQEEKWQRGAARKIISTYQEGTLALEDRGVDLIVWPEASWPLDLHFDSGQVPMPLGNQRADLLFGAVTRPHRFQGKRNEMPYYNTALLVNSDGEIFDYYHKAHLVPFGEYVPYRDFFFFARKLTTQVGHLYPGTSFAPMKFRDLLVGVLICYEDIFPEIAREMTARGAGALINITNDAWYGRSSAAYQHQVFSQFRSIETRRALARATNTGLSSMIDRYGRILWEGKLFEREDFVTQLPFYLDRSVYVRIGDAFCYAALGLMAVLMIIAAVRRRDL